MDISTNGGFNDQRPSSRVSETPSDVESVAKANGNTVIGDTGTVARAGDTVKFINGPLIGMEFPVLGNTANSLTLAGDQNPVVGNTFYVLRKTTERVNADGTGIVATESGPTQFVKDGINVTVNRDTATPLNSRPLPAEILFAGNPISPLTDNQLRASPVAVVGPLTDIQLRSTALPVSGPLTDAQLRNTAVPVSGSVSVSNFPATQPVSGSVSVSNFPATQPVSAVSLPLPTGAATEVTLQQVRDRIPALGQTTMANSQPVVIASDQLPLQVSSPDLLINGAAAQTTAGNNILLTTPGTAALDVSGYRSGSVQIVSAGATGNFVFENSNDGVNFQPMPVYNSALTNGTAIVASIGATASQLIYTFPIRSRFIRVRIGTATTGGVTAFTRISQESWSPAVMTIAQSNSGNLNANIATLTSITNAVTAAQATAAAKTVKNARVTVGTTALRATTDGAAVTAGRTLLRIRPLDTNTGIVYCGSSTVTTATGFMLYPGESIDFLYDAGDYYIISDTVGQSVYILEQE